MKGTLALITVLLSLAAPVLAGAATSSATSGGGGSGGGASHAGGGSSGAASGHAGSSVGSASHATAVHVAAAHAIVTHVTADRLMHVRAATLARADATKPKVPLKPAPTRNRGEGYSTWKSADFYCADRDYSLGVLGHPCSRSSKSSGKGG